MSVKEQRQQLTALAQILNARGWNSQLITPSGAPLLRVIDPQGIALTPEHIICERGRDNADRYRWRQSRDDIASADEPDTAAEEIIRALTPREQR